MRPLSSTPTDRCRDCDRPRVRGFATCEIHGGQPELRQENSVPSTYDAYDDEPDWESIAEARAEARAERDLERAEAAYERWVYGD